MLRLTLFWSNLRASFWFLPYLIVSAFVGAAIMLTHLRPDTASQWRNAFPQLFDVGAAGARDMLATIANCMISVVGIVFSMTLVALALASTQYSSRVVRSFMRSRLTQVAIGVFAGLYVYCLIVLRGIKGRDDDLVVPIAAVTLAIVGAIAAVALLIFFIHHIAMSIQSATILASVADETIATIKQMFPLRGDSPPSGELPPEPELDTAAKPVRSSANGYIQSIDDAALLRFACDHQLLIRLQYGVGQFVVAGTALMTVSGRIALDARTMHHLRSLVAIDAYRTIEQDPAFGIRQMVDVSIKALSPAINDTSTAIMGLDYLGATLAALAPRHIPAPWRRVDGQLRLVTVQPDFGTLVDEAFDQIRRNASGNVSIMLRIATSLETLGTFPLPAGGFLPLSRQLAALEEFSERSVGAAAERAQVRDRIASARASLAASRRQQEREGTGEPAVLAKSG